MTVRRSLMVAVMVGASLLLSSFAAPETKGQAINPFGVKDRHVPAPYIKFNSDGTVVFADDAEFCQ